MKKIGKPWFHAIIPSTLVAFAFALVMVGNALFALVGIMFTIIRHPLRWPKKLREMKEEWNGRVD